MKKKLLLFCSYVLVAALASAVTLFLLVPREGTGKLQQLEGLIDEMFIGEADLTKLEDQAAEAMVKAIGDRWSYYISARDYDAYREQMDNAYVGVGITITPCEDGGFRIIQVTSGSGAEDAGMQVEDVLVAVEGEDVRQSESSHVRELVKGPEGTTVSMTVLRADEELTMDVQRRKVETPVAQGQLLQGNVGYITIENFDTRCAQETIGCIEQLREQGADRLLFDVRNNPGGYASELVKVLDYLLPEGEVFHTLRYDGEENIDMSDADCLDLPIAVLVNAESYSAAEFFAAALQEYGAAVVVGEKTVGKGYFQNTFRLNDGSAVALSVGKYFTPKGVCLAGVGITPDVECPVDQEIASKIRYGTLPTDEDPQIQAAIDALSR